MDSRLSPLKPKRFENVEELEEDVEKEANKLSVYNCEFSDSVVKGMRRVAGKLKKRVKQNKIRKYKRVRKRIQKWKQEGLRLLRSELMFLSTWLDASQFSFYIGSMNSEIDVLAKFNRGLDENLLLIFHQFSHAVQSCLGYNAFLQSRFTFMSRVLDKLYNVWYVSKDDALTIYPLHYYEDCAYGLLGNFQFLSL